MTGAKGQTRTWCAPLCIVWFSAGVAALQTSGGGSTGVAAARRRCAVTTVSAAAAASSETAALARVEPVVLTLEPSMMLQRAVPPGLVYRDALLRYTGLMLPRPSFFDTAYYAAVDSNLASSPRFGAENGESAETWWRKVARDTYDGVLKGTEHPYDADELEQVDGVFEALFAELHDDLFLGSEAWELSPDTERILRELREWRDSRGGPRIGMLSVEHDARAAMVLRRLLGNEVADATFDFYIGADDAGGAALFEAARKSHGAAHSECVHVALTDERRPYERTFTEAVSALVDAPSRVVRLDFDDIKGIKGVFQLPRTPEDEIIITTRTYDVYAEDPSGY